MFLATPEQESVAVLEQTRDEVGALADAGADGAEIGDQGWSARLRAWFGEDNPGGGVQARLEAFRARVSEAVEHIVRLIALFTLQTILLPLLFLWLAGRLFSLAT